MASRILIVEDSLHARNGLIALLQGAGYDVTGASSMREAIEIVESEPPDLIITDVRLADDNGLYLAAVNPGGIPVVVVTGYPDRGLESEARELGADFLLKPFRPSELLAAVERRLLCADGGEGVPMVRRSPRRRPTADLPATVGDTSVRIIDVSYSGVRLTGERDADILTQPSFRLSFPTAALSVPVRVVWHRESAAGQTCGALVPDEWRPHWRQLVDSVS
jgi:DNA-binding response OmpR family regulator